MSVSNSRTRSLAWIVLPVGLLLAAGLLMAGLLVYGLTGYFRLGADARCLRNSVTESITAQALPFQRKFQLNVGPLTCGAVRAGLSFVDLEPEVRAAVSAARGAEVSIYEISRRARTVDRSAVLMAADEAMTGRGWERIVGVLQEDTLVAVYLPQSLSPGAKVHACVAVLSGRDLVIASARSNLAPLLELAMDQSEWRGSEGNQWARLFN